MRRTSEVPDFPVLRDKDQVFKHVCIFDYFIFRICHEHGGILMGLDTLTLKPHFSLDPVKYMYEEYFDNFWISRQGRVGMSCIPKEPKWIG